VDLYCEAIGGMNNIYLWDITFLVNKFLFNLEGVINLHF